MLFGSCYFNFNFLAIYNFFYFFQKVEKINISAIYKSIITILTVHLPLYLCIYTSFVKKKFKSNHQENSRTSHYLFFFNLLFLISFKWHFQFQNQPPGEPREHHLGEVLQGRLKSKFNIILS